MTRLTAMLFLIAAFALPASSARSQDLKGDESNAAILEKLDSIVLQLRSIEKRLSMLESEPLAFNFEYPITTKGPSLPVIRWLPQRRARIDPSIDAGILFDEGLVVPISIYSTPEGEIEKLEIGQRVISAPSIEELLAAFRTALADIVQLGSDTVSIRVGENLRYERLMQIVDICGKQELATGERLSKVSIVPLKAN